MAAIPGKAKPTPWMRFTKYLREVRAEFRKVVWPNRKEMITYTVVVLFSVLVVAAFIGVVDVVVSKLLALLAGIGR